METDVDMAGESCRVVVFDVEMVVVETTEKSRGCTKESCCSRERKWTKRLEPKRVVKNDS